MLSEREFQSMITGENLRRLGCLRNISRGYQIARKEAGRKLVESLEVACFALFLREIGEFVPRQTALAHTFRIQDIIERQNRYGDEKRSWGENSANPYWERDHFAGEFAGIGTSILQDLVSTYGDKEGRRRATIIDQALERWFFVNWVVEQRIRGKPLDEFNEEERIALGPLAEENIDDLARLSREIDDTCWLKAVMNVITDADQILVDKHFETVFGAVLLLQLADDFANTSRNRRTNKVAFFSHGPTSLQENDRFVEKLKMFLRSGSSYLEKIKITPPLKKFVELAWLARSVFTHVKAELRQDNHYSNDKFVDRCNTFEERVAKRLFRENADGKEEKPERKIP